MSLLRPYKSSVVLSLLSRHTTRKNKEQKKKNKNTVSLLFIENKLSGVKELRILRSDTYLSGVWVIKWKTHRHRKHIGKIHLLLYVLSTYVFQ